MIHNRVSWNTFLHRFKVRDDHAKKFGAVTKVEKEIMNINYTQLIGLDSLYISVVESSDFCNSLCKNSHASTMFR